MGVRFRSFVTRAKSGRDVHRSEEKAEPEQKRMRRVSEAAECDRSREVAGGSTFAERESERRSLRKREKNERRSFKKEGEK